MRTPVSFASSLMPPTDYSLVAQMAIPEPVSTELPHDNLDPSQHLPGLPWWVAPLGFLALLALAAVAFKFLRRDRSPSPRSDQSLPPLQQARQALNELNEQGENLDVPTFATKLSLILRTYLATAKNDPSLFETREEFLAQADRLKTLPAGARQKLDELFAELNQFQYARPTSDPSQCQSLLTQARQVLEGLSSTPTSELPTGNQLPEKSVNTLASS